MSALLIVLACVLTPLGELSTWAKYQIGDTDNYVSAMAPLASDPDVQEAVATAVAGEIGKHIDAGPLQGALTTFVQEAVESFTGTEAYRTAWNAAIRAAHEAVQNALKNGDDGSVVIDLAPITQEVKDQLVADGVPFARRIPVQHTEVEVMKSKDLVQLRKGLHMLQVAGIWLPVAAVLCAVAGIASAVRRRKAVIATALGMALASALLGLGLWISRRLTLSDLPPDVSRGATGAVFDALTSSLRTAVWVIAAVGVVVAAGTYASRRLGRTGPSGEVGP
ncbi:hypothetical protein H9Y04_17665 [Streptomyces sp. TRM66268-LWL]|uniref:Integral membrane protein n=1 Tax=Streptomyces polyasparticus TaxID=2767826 RepID=A0ABR7SFY0_9ACTN|nr:hypothetical protein [Streptomyces polyasparticus]MBC9714390.1 hypothetical protein [Streptomyces polyasparticus]